MKSDKATPAKKLIIRATVFLIVFLLLDQGIGSLLRLAYFSAESNSTYGIEQTEAEIIIVGSSRANSHYIPSIISDTLGMSCFNNGSGGQNIYYFYGIVGAILERYTPRIVIMDILGSDIEVRGHDTDRLSGLLPFYKSSPSIKEIIDLRGNKERIKLQSGIYPFNSQLTSIVFSYVKKGRNPLLIMDGYIPLDGKISSPPFSTHREKEIVLDTFKIGLFEKTAKLCLENDVKLILIVSPRYVNFEECNFSIESLKDVMSRYGVTFWDYEQDPFFLSHSELFRDELHLNHQGAVEYSKIIAGRIKKDLFGGNDKAALSKENSTAGCR